MIERSPQKVFKDQVAKIKYKQRKLREKTLQLNKEFRVQWVAKGIKGKLLETMQQMQDDVEVEEPKDLLINRVKAALKKKTMTVMRR